jgi:hypothetical protein
VCVVKLNGISKLNIAKSMRSEMLSAVAYFGTPAAACAGAPPSACLYSRLSEVRTAWSMLEICGINLKN